MKTAKRSSTRFILIVQKNALRKTYSMGYTDDTCSDCTKEDYTQGTEALADWTMYPAKDHCYSQTMSNGNDQSWMISSKGYDDFKLYIDTIVDNSCIERTSTAEATCGKLYYKVGLV
jgi:hypothetical protein